MTVYTGALNRRLPFQRGGINRRQTISVRIWPTSVLGLNLILVSTAIIVAVAYVFMSNSLVSKRYVLSTRKSELNRLSVKLLAEKQFGANYNLKELLLFAQKSGMTEAKDSDSILKKDGLAVIP